jgi:chromosome segregation ATPase
VYWLEERQAMTDSPSVEERVKRAAKAEKRLIAQEARAERRLLRARQRLAAAESQLERVLRRVERRRQRVSEAEATLRACQQARAAGPAITTAEPGPRLEDDLKPAEHPIGLPVDPAQT